LDAVRAAGEYAHVVVRVERGHLMVYAGDEEPVARLTPLGQRSPG
jgi:antitoxin (DNA-binding transcriptional repressor) of toxin-antitoxin stability system